MCIAKPEEEKGEEEEAGGEGIQSNGGSQYWNEEASRYRFKLERESDCFIQA